jgi:hypothetical protein
MSHFDYKSFDSIDLQSEFFDSLRDDYPAFDEWFAKKSINQEKAYVLYNDNEQITAFLYLKIETELDPLISPPLPREKVLKVGTLKIQAHGTRLGERVIKKIMDNATERNIHTIYVTIFDKHEHLISILLKYGFRHWGIKSGAAEEELVLVKSLDPVDMLGDIFHDYPLFSTENSNCWGLSIYPKYHTKLFPDSILKNESYDLLSDIAPTNTISKIYLSAMKCINEMSQGDIVLIYRTSDNLGPARYRSVVTSICVLEEVSNIYSYTREQFLSYCSKGSIFTLTELEYFYNSKKYPFILRMTYNISLQKRVTNEQLQEVVGLSPAYWGCFSVTESQLLKILTLGEANKSLVRLGSHA